MKKKLLITADCRLPGWDGIVRFLYEIIPRLKDHYDITLLVPKGKGRFRPIKGAVTIRLPIYNYQIADLYLSKLEYRKIKKIIEKADIVFNQAVGPIGFCSILAASKLKKPLISYMHCIDWEITTKGLDKFKRIVNLTTKLYAKYLYKKCDLIIVPSLETKEKIIKENIKTKMRLVPLGVDINEFKPTENKENAKARLGIDKNIKIIGYCGRIGREKNIITLYRAFSRLEKKHKDIKLLIVGKGIKELEDEFTSSRNVIMTGQKDNVIPYLQAMDMFVMPSLTETSSLATMEAMSCGIPPITTPVGYVKEYVIDRENGMIFPFKNSLVLSMKIEILLKDEEYRLYLGRKARETIEKQFNWDKTVEGIKKVLEKF